MTPLNYWREGGRIVRKKENSNNNNVNDVFCPKGKDAPPHTPALGDGLQSLLK